MTCANAIQSARQSWNIFRKELQCHIAGKSHFARMANQAEAGNIGHAVHAIFAIANKVRSLLVQSRHRLNRSIDPGLIGQYLF